MHPRICRRYDVIATRDVRLVVSGRLLTPELNCRQIYILRYPNKGFRDDMQNTIRRGMPLMQGGIKTLIIIKSATADGFLGVSMLPCLFWKLFISFIIRPSGLDSAF
jgi:hypothetical protein